MVFGNILPCISMAYITKLHIIFRDISFYFHIATKTQICFIIIYYSIIAKIFYVSKIKEVFHLMKMFWLFFMNVFKAIILILFGFQLLMFINKILYVFALSFQNVNQFDGC